MSSTHATVFEAMKVRLSSHRLEDDSGRESRPLAELRTRDSADPSIALLDAWATVADVLTFYQARITNEGYLRTATERRSVAELARLTGYRPRPGVAASAYLAYTIDDNTSAPVVIEAGARVQSVPGPDELPQTFETSAQIEARASWNRLVPRRTQPQPWDVVVDTGRVFLKGTSTNLQPNDPLLIGNGASVPDLFRVISVTADGDANRTEVTVARWEGAPLTRAGTAAVEIVSKLIDAAPPGRMSSLVVEELKAVREVAAAAVEAADIMRRIEDRTLPLVKQLHEQLPANATRLAAWLTDVRLTLVDLVTGLGRRQDDATAQQATTFSARLNTLLRKPSQPRADPLQLPRSLKAGFRPASDAGLRLLGLASPDLRSNLGAAMSTYTGASPALTLEVYALRVKAGVFGRNAPKRQRTRRSGQDDQEIVTEPIGEWPIVTRDTSSEARQFASTESPGTVFLDAKHDGILPGTWLVVDCSAVPVFEAGTVRVVPAMFPEGRERDAAFRKHRVTRVTSAEAGVTRAEYGMSGDSVRVDLADDWLRFDFGEDAEGGIGTPRDQARVDREFQVIRSTAVYARSERLDLAEAPVTSPVCDGAGTPLELDGLYQDLEPGRFVIVTGERSDVPETSGIHSTEAVMIAAVVHDVRRADAPIPVTSTTATPLGDGAARDDAAGDGAALPGDRTHTFVYLDAPLSHCYRRDTLTIYGNVVKATHGETRVETLGSGDGAQGLQTFTLKQPPLTYVAAPTATGAESTLRVFIDDVRWHEHASFVDIGSTERAYVLSIDDAGRTTVTFGDGREGARVPAGTANVKAVYRSGLGSAGNVRAGQLSLLSTRPLGVKEVTNPLRASGGADRDSRDDIRRNAPRAVMSLDRLVSTADYADFAGSFAGIGKASAVELSDGRRTVVHVTIAGIDDVPIDTASELFLNLRRALRDLGDPFQPVVLAARELRILVISAGVRIHADHRWERVVTDLRASLTSALGFDSRDLAQDVTSSEVLRAMHAVAGVEYVDLDVFGAMASMVADPDAEGGARPLTPDETTAEIQRITGRTPAPRVVVQDARIDAARIAPAQLAVLVPAVPDTLVLNQIHE